MNNEQGRCRHSYMLECHVKENINFITDMLKSLNLIIESFYFLFEKELINNEVTLCKVMNCGNPSLVQ